MEVDYKHLKFFRFRSPAYVRGEFDGVGWIFDSIEFIDFNSETLIDEVYVIVQIANGGFSYTELRDMDFNDYEQVVRRTKPIAEKMNEGQNG